MATLGSSGNAHGAISSCQSSLQEKLIKTSEQTFTALKWPWKSGEIMQILASIEIQKSTIIMGLQGATAEATQDMRRMVRDIQQQQNDGKIREWLSAPDPNTNFSAAREKCQLETGTWFLESQEFSQWFQLGNQSLWLYGIPRAGKTVLSSSIIESVVSRCDPDTVCAYFYFDSNSMDVKDRTVSSLVSSLLVQISATKVPDVLQ